MGLPSPIPEEVDARSSADTASSAGQPGPRSPFVPLPSPSRPAAVRLQQPQQPQYLQQPALGGGYAARQQQQAAPAARQWVPADGVSQASADSSAPDSSIAGSEAAQGVDGAAGDAVDEADVLLESGRPSCAPVSLWNCF